VFFLSPAKLLVIVVIGLVVLGPDKLPTVAKQIGGLWGDFRRFRQKLESEVRGNFPDLPSTDTITQAVRSPLSFLDTLAESQGSANQPASNLAAGGGPGAVEGDGLAPSSAINRPAGTVGVHGVPPPVPELPVTDRGVTGHRVRSVGSAVADDAGMN
jgi:sec-independent protein translocase protein TatB